MKNLVVIISLLFTAALQAQSLEGKWKISTLIRETGADEYALFPADSSKFNYGNNIWINKNGTFTSFYSAPCGNDCFTTTSGKYEIVNGNHIRFFLEKINMHGDCHGDSEPNKDLGLYYIYNEKGTIRLIKSDGNIVEDKNKITYIGILASLNEEYTKYEYFGSMDIVPADVDENSLTDVIAYSMRQNKIAKYEILYTTNASADNRYSTALLKVDNQYCCIYYPQRSRQVTFSSDAFIKKTDKSVLEIKQDKKLKHKTIERPYDEKLKAKSTIDIYLKNKKIQKLIYEKEYDAEKSFMGLFLTTTLYFENENPICYEIERYDAQKKCIANRVYYVKNWPKYTIIQMKDKPGEEIRLRSYESEMFDFEGLLALSKTATEQNQI